MKLTASQLRSIIAEETSRLTEAPRKKLPKRKPTARANSQSAVNAIVQYLSHALVDRHNDVLSAEIHGIMKEMMANGKLTSRELDHMSPAYLQRLEWSEALKRNLVPELARMVATAAFDLRSYDPADDE